MNPHKRCGSDSSGGGRSGCGGPGAGRDVHERRPAIARDSIVLRSGSWRGRAAEEGDHEVRALGHGIRPDTEGCADDCGSGGDGFDSSRTCERGNPESGPNAGAVIVQCDCKLLSLLRRGSSLSLWYSVAGKPRLSLRFWPITSLPHAATPLWSKPP